MDLISKIMGSTPAKGAAIGALMSNVLGQMSTPGGVVQPMDMSKFGIPARTTNIAPVNYVPYSQYGTRDTSVGMSPDMARAFGAPSGLASLQPMSAYSQVPSLFTNRQPMQITSAGSGESRMPTLSLTPKNNNKISPLTGTLLGAAAGYLLPSSSSASAANAAGSAAAGSLWDKVVNNIIGGFGGSGYSGVVPKEDLGSQTFPINPDLESGGSTDTTNWESEGEPTIDDYSGSSANLYELPYANGGMATPLMADGGDIEPPSFYTYGTSVDPRQIMNNMAHGGRPQGGLHVPVVEGRHDYRAGARVMGPGDGQSDDIPAMLADGEYVIDAETVAQLGNGSSKAGSDMLDKFREEIRAHKRSAPVTKIPPQSKSPLQYLKQAQSRSKKNG
jgi:hypothetical protein